MKYAEAEFTSNVNYLKEKKKKHLGRRILNFKDLLLTKEGRRRIKYSKGDWKIHLWKYCFENEKIMIGARIHQL